MNHALKTAGMTHLERLRYHLEQCDPKTVSDAHLRAALLAVRDYLEAEEHKRFHVATYATTPLI